MSFPLDNGWVFVLLVFREESENVTEGLANDDDEVALYGIAGMHMKVLFKCIRILFSIF